jgi:hypothetical protein
LKSTRNVKKHVTVTGSSSLPMCKGADTIGRAT